MGVWSRCSEMGVMERSTKSDVTVKQKQMIWTQSQPLFDASN
jgi:hypothetical protein